MVNDSAGTASGGSTPDTPATSLPPARRSSPPTAILLGVFAILTFAMTFRSLDRFDSFVVGDNGDAILVLWILGWVQHAIPHGWDTLWNANIFFDAPNTLAYSEAMLPVAIVAWPLRVVFGTTLGFNLLSFAAQTATLWFMYRLALRLTRSWMAAFVAALAFAFATPLLQQIWHAQLMMTAFFVPLVVLLVIRYFDLPTLGRGAAIGAALGVLTASATYYGTMMAVATAVLTVGWLVFLRPPDVARSVRGLVLGAGIAAAITLPVALPYIELQQDAHFRRGADEQFQAHLTDFLSPVPDNLVLTEIPEFEARAGRGGVESHLFPGIVALGFGAIGLVVLVRAVRRDGASDASVEADATVETQKPGRRPAGDGARQDALISLLVVLAGLVSLVLAFGDAVTVLGHEVPLPFKALRHFVPGFSGIRVTTRFTVMAQCSLAVLAAFGLRSLFARLGHRGALVVLVFLSAFVIAETAREVPMTRVPGGAAIEAVNRALERRPDGTVAELPMRAADDGVAWAYVEAPRQFLSLIDGHARVNGYSGFTPRGFEALAARANTFPSAGSLKALARHGVRYVVLRTRVVGDQVPELRAQLSAEGVGRYTNATAAAMLERLPSECVRKAERLPGAFLVELNGPRKLRASCIPAARVSAP